MPAALITALIASAETPLPDSCAMSVASETARSSFSTADSEATNDIFWGGERGARAERVGDEVRPRCEGERASLPSPPPRRRSDARRPEGDRRLLWPSTHRTTSAIIAA
jgi:hypothetical protein